VLMLVPMPMLMGLFMLVHGRSGIVCKLSYINFLVCVL
jgi:hypothetical protein